MCHSSNTLATRIGFQMNLSLAQSPIQRDRSALKLQLEQFGRQKQTNSSGVTLK